MEYSQEARRRRGALKENERLTFLVRVRVRVRVRVGLGLGLGLGERTAELAVM